MILLKSAADTERRIPNDQSSNLPGSTCDTSGRTHFSRALCRYLERWSWNLPQRGIAISVEFAARMAMSRAWRRGCLEHHVGIKRAVVLVGRGWYCRKIARRNRVARVLRQRRGLDLAGGVRKARCHQQALISIVTNARQAIEKACAATQQCVWNVLGVCV